MNKITPIMNSELFFRKAVAFQDERKRIMDEYEKRIASLESTRGSKFYEDEMKAAEDKKTADLAALRAEYSAGFRAILESMSKTNHSRKLLAPSAEQMRLLQLLKMREKITEPEMEAAAATLADNVTALAVLNEIGHAAGFVRSFMDAAESKEMAVDEVDQIIKSLGDALADFQAYDTRATARKMANRNAELYGTQPIEPLPKRPLFSTKSGCYETLINLSGDALESFCAAVDA